MCILNGEYIESKATHVCVIHSCGCCDYIFILKNRKSKVNIGDFPLASGFSYSGESADESSRVLGIAGSTKVL